MKLIFCGTPQFALPTLHALIEAEHHVQLVVCQPDRPRGRGQQIAVPAVKQRAIELGLEITQPEKIKNNAEFRARLEALNPDAIIVVAYGRIIPAWMLALPCFGNINLHASLLPKYRGAAPIQWAIANGEQTTGVTTMRLEEGLDTGGILLQQKISIDPNDTAATLAPRLAKTGADLMVKTMHQLESGELIPIAQDDSNATLAPLLAREDGHIDFSRPAQVIVNRMRGFQPWPGAYATYHGKNLQITDARAIPPAADALLPGTLQASGGRLLAWCGENTILEILELQPEGKRRMSAREFVSGYSPQDNELLGG